MFFSSVQKFWTRNFSNEIPSIIYQKVYRYTPFSFHFLGEGEKGRLFKSSNNDSEKRKGSKIMNGHKSTIDYNSAFLFTHSQWKLKIPLITFEILPFFKHKLCKLISFVTFYGQWISTGIYVYLIHLRKYI